MNALVFGGSGAIGAATAAKLTASGAHVLTTSRVTGAADLVIDPMSNSASLSLLEGIPAADAVIWAQGANLNDSAQSVDAEAFRDLVDANVTFVAATLGHLVRHGRLAPAASLVVVSSIWEEIARPGKFSYGITKAAVGGLVRAAAADLAVDGHRINAVLPGVTDTPMTREMLSAEQVGAVEGATGFGRLVSLDEVVAAIVWLCSDESSGISGQSLKVDLGFTSVRSL